MKLTTVPLAEPLAGLANMLACWEYNTEDQAIALGMNAPYLFLHEEGKYLAGSMLYRPKWLNLYLHPRGFHLEEVRIPRDAISAFLRSQRTAMLALKHDQESFHLAVYTGYVGERYAFTTIKRASDPEPDTLSLSIAMLKRRLPDNVRISTLKPCPPQEVDFAPLLLQSMETLNTYEDELLKVREMTLTRQEFRQLYEPLFRALITELLPLAILTNDVALAEELVYLQHDHRHTFTHNSPEKVALYERLPKSSIKDCILWLKEDIADKLFELGVDDASVLPLLHRHNASKNPGTF